MGQLTVTAGAIKDAAAASAKQYMNVISEKPLTTDQIQQLFPRDTGLPSSGFARGRVAIYETAFKIQEGYQNHVKTVYCGEEGTHKRAPVKKWQRVYQVCV